MLHGLGWGHRGYIPKSKSQQRGPGDRLPRGSGDGHVVLFRQREGTWHLLPGRGGFGDHDGGGIPGLGAQGAAPQSSAWLAASPQHMELMYPRGPKASRKTNKDKVTSFCAERERSYLLVD